jgi:hypothetical protein
MRLRMRRPNELPPRQAAKRLCDKGGGDAWQSLFATPLSLNHSHQRATTGQTVNSRMTYAEAEAWDAGFILRSDPAFFDLRVPVVASSWHRLGAAFGPSFRFNFCGLWW